MSLFIRSALTAAVVVSWVAIDSANAGSSDVVLDYLLMPSAGSFDLESIDGQIRAMIIVGEDGPVGVSASSASALEAHFGTLRIFVPVPEPHLVLQAIAALTTTSLLGLRRGHSNGRDSGLSR